MQVEFHKTGERRYAVVVLRNGLPKLKMNPAPGFDPLMPHDMLHFLVEQEFEIPRGIFGQLKLGGTAGTFRPETSSKKSNKRANSRLRRKLAKRGKTFSEKGNDYDQSERATYVCWQNWLAHSADKQFRSQALEMKDEAESIFARMPENEKALYNKKKLAEIRARMDEVSRRWSELQIGEFISLEWTL
jgi:hypothetical protein